jgi:hypothetical protein
MANPIKAIPDQIALSKIKANINDSPTISVKQIIKLVSREDIELHTVRSLMTAIQSASNRGDRQLYKQEVEVLEILSNYQYPQETIITVRKGFTEVNHAFRERGIKKLYKEVLKEPQNRDNIQKLIDYCDETLEIVSNRDGLQDDLSPIKITPFLYYVG